MDENRTRLEQPQQDAPKKRSLWPLFFFPMALLYHELLLHAFDRTILLSLIHISEPTRPY